MKRTTRLKPCVAPLRPATPSTGPTALQIASATINVQEREIARLKRSNVSVEPALTFEAKLFAELLTYRDLYAAEMKKTVKWRLRAHEAEHRVTLLEDRLHTMQMVNDQQEKAN